MSGTRQAQVRSGPEAIDPHSEPHPAPQPLTRVSQHYLYAGSKGLGISRLAPAMETLDSGLRSALTEIANRNLSVLQAMRATADELTATHPRFPSHHRGPAVPGALPHAEAAGTASATNPPQLPDVPGSLTASPARLVTALTPARAAAGGTGGGAVTAAVSLAAGPRWGVSEGGRDTLGWVRSLVRHGDTSPLGLQIDSPGTSGPR